MITKTEQSRALSDIGILVNAITDMVLGVIIEEPSSLRQKNHIRKSRLDIDHCRRIVNSADLELEQKECMDFRLTALSGFLVLLEARADARFGTNIDLKGRQLLIDAARHLKEALDDVKSLAESLPAQKNAPQ